MQHADFNRRIKDNMQMWKKAIFNGRKIDGIFVFEGKQVVIDGVQKVEYESMCAECYFMRKEEELKRLSGEQLSF